MAFTWETLASFFTPPASRISAATAATTPDSPSIFAAPSRAHLPAPPPPPPCPRHHHHRGRHPRRPHYHRCTPFRPRSATEVVAPEPMSRSFPAPAEEPSMDELLARKPGKWSLGHYVKNAREATHPQAKEGEEEERKRKFEEVKGALRRAKEEMEKRGGQGLRFVL
ncbi:hypothetical protein N0V88_005962 [Collariella sp. IMI 366227]|nr:hypothetical protein N0V88_005962 [Collariella sp. IMI 366227]